jgi:hypothetical protein
MGERGAGEPDEGGGKQDLLQHGPSSFKLNDTAISRASGSGVNRESATDVTAC